MASFKEPESLAERSLFQYRCQKYELSKLLCALMNISAFIALPAAGLFSSRSAETPEKHRAIFLTDGLDDSIIPASLKSEFGGDVKAVTFKSRMCLGEYERRFIRDNLLHSGYDPYFILKCVAKIGLYAGLFAKHSPEAIIVYGEYSFTSSLLTEYCRSRGIEHINIMHGERMLNLRDSFVCFDRFYVWEEEYKELFISMRAEREQFIVEAPIMSLPAPLPQKRFTYTYYLDSEDGDEARLIRLRETLVKLADGASLCIRLHPHSQAPKLVKSVFEGFALQEPSKVDIVTSILQSEHVIATYSTVLYQAFRYGVPAVIDDISAPEQYSWLEEMGYIMLQKSRLRLSHIISNL